MNKFKSFMEKLKKNMLLIIVVWLLIAILLVAPITYTVTEALLRGETIVSGIIYDLFDNILKFPITVVFENTYINDFIQGMKIYTIVYSILVFVSISKSLPKTAFDNIEHGSSDWCESGEQYKILDKKKGLLLAKENYLPVNKPGNVNVLIVGRFRFW